VCSSDLRFHYLTKAINAKISQYKCFRDALNETGNYVIELDTSEYDSDEVKNEVIYILRNIRGN
jgi:hypothetical protein